MDTDDEKLATLMKLTERWLAPNLGYTP